MADKRGDTMVTSNHLKGISNIGQWVTWNPDKKSMEIGEGGTWFIEDGLFTHFSPESITDSNILNCHGMLLTPGLIDSHTHPAFAATREDEFEMRSQGKSYLEIAEAGGGIRNSVRKLREISEIDLTDLIETRLNLMLQHGTTTAECKSGYGLSTAAEIKSLRAIQAASARTPLHTYSTLLGAHEIPDEYQQNRAAYVALIIDEMIPAVAQQDLATYCDVFCETGVYTPVETEQILLAARQHGLELKFHADEFVSSGGAELAAKIGALSADHLMAVSAAGISALADSDTVATLLPGTTFFLGSSTWAPARKLIDAGISVALATDFNPGSNMSLSLPFIMTLAVIYLHMTPLEALQAVTQGAAKSMGIDNATGCIFPGFQADAVLWQAENYRQLPYFYGSNQVKQIMVGGEMI